MTAQAASVLLGARQPVETNDLADIAAAGNVLGRGSVARFATVTATPGGLEVRGVSKFL